MIFFRLTILVVEAGMLISFTCERNPFLNVYVSMRLQTLNGLVWTVQSKGFTYPLRFLRRAITLWNS